jgi:hypothetical protein
MFATRAITGEVLKIAVRCCKIEVEDLQVEEKSRTAPLLVGFAKIVFSALSFF